MEKYLADENIPYLTVKELQEKNISIISVIDIKKGLEDENILQYAFENELIIITHDKDFGELIFKNEFPTKGIILIRVVFDSNKDLTNLLYDIITNTELPKYDTFITVKRNHIRLRKV